MIFFLKKRKSSKREEYLKKLLTRICCLLEVVRKITFLFCNIYALKALDKFVDKDGGSLSDNESSRYHKETNYLGKRFSSKTINFSDFDSSAALNVRQVLYIKMLLSSSLFFQLIFFYRNPYLLSIKQLMILQFPIVNN